MAKFIFKMESILSVKYKLEDQAKAEYGTELARLRDEEIKLEHLKAKKEGYQEQLTKVLHSLLDVQKIRNLEDAVEHAKYNINLQKVVIKQQQMRVDKAREKLDEAMKERKTYEKLKEKAFEEFKQEIEAEERKEIDELVSFRFQSSEESEEI